MFVGTGDTAGDEIVNAVHPEANAFGSLGGKRVELLKGAVPKITRVAHLVTAVGKWTW